jgi:FKBP-type peptidyl-prolyl cis-trans isomerase
MREGERARIHVPAELGYGASPQGSKVNRSEITRCPVDFRFGEFIFVAQHA